MPTMKALVSTGDKSGKVQDIEVPKPGDGEILVKVHYAAQNPTDWKAMSMAPAGRIVGCDFAGTVENSNGSHWSKGQRVAGFVQGTSTNGIQPNPDRGVFAEYAVIEASLVYPIPESISYQKAATIPLAFATAVQAMFQRLQLPEPSKPATSAFPFLVNGGTTSVGKYAVQLGKLAGLFVIATGSKQNHALLSELGADAVVDYRDSNWPEEVRKLSHDNLEYAFDCISEKGTTVQIAKALSSSKGGNIVTLLPTKKEEVTEVNSKAKTQSTIVYTVFERELRYGKLFDNQGKPTPEDKAFWEKYLSLLPDWLESGKIKPNRVKESGGIDDILKGFKLQQEGRVSAEKLVYKIA